MVKDFLIIGQGVAGSALAYKLIQAGKSVLVVDREPTSTSSRVAAGLFNPVVFKRITLGWRAIEAINELTNFYLEVEKETNALFFHPQQMFRIHGSEGEGISWVQMKTQKPFDEFLGNSELVSKRPFFYQLFGSALVNNAGNVNAKVYVESIKKWLIQKDAYKTAAFDYDALILKNDSISWYGIEAEKIIFCEGYKAESNPFFNYLPFNTAKGEELIIECKDIAQELINGSIYGVPMGNHIFKIGSTFAWNQVDELTTKAAREEIEGKFKKISNASYKILGQNAGIRPAVKDRRPFVGIHPKHKQLGIFNGMGTKGISLSPLLAKEFVQYLMFNTPLDKECDIKRFENKLVAP
jgi:glycine/D-amino acid oxidase-like deaminating enzyme